MAGAATAACIGGPSFTAANGHYNAARVPGLVPSARCTSRAEEIRP